MIGIHRATGAALDDWHQFVERATRALTTPLGTRPKRPLYGCRLPTRLARNTGDGLLILAQADAADAFYNPANGIGDFSPEVVVATREGAGIRLALAGKWRNRAATFEVVT